MAVNIKKAVPSKLKAKGSVYEKFLKDVTHSPTSITGDNLKVSLHHKEVAGNVTLEKKVSGQVVHAGKTQETVLKGVAADPSYAKVGCSGGRTLQPAPFESVRVDVWLELPCPNDPASINNAYDFVTDWVSNKLQEAEAAFKGQDQTKTVTVAAYPSTAGDPTAGYTKTVTPSAGTFTITDK